ncbi:hypothetical protein L484_010074 [Morus notabilis]|uniref:Uncharacterized protein n=1 Tax=Morus notabilis TaxID=981085 RepID=W9RML7_9ROSA|nr:hypothetical protein L484_010074 [Morus notabilis]
MRCDPTLPSRLFETKHKAVDMMSSTDATVVLLEKPPLNEESRSNGANKSGKPKRHDLTVQIRSFETKNKVADMMSSTDATIVLLEKLPLSENVSEQQASKNLTESPVYKEKVPSTPAVRLNYHKSKGRNEESLANGANTSGKLKTRDLIVPIHPFETKNKAADMMSSNDATVVLLKKPPLSE